MNRTNRIIWLLLFVCGRLAAAEPPASELRFAELGECALEAGGVIEDCRLGYRTLGRLNETRSNAVLFPTWYTGSTANLVNFGYIGPGRIADTDHYFIIAVDAFGNGVSSSPSNSARQALENFPDFGIRDMVHAQHRLLTESLGLERLHAVVGVSMGAFQAFEWLLQYPQAMGRVVAIEGTPWPNAYDRLLWTSWRDAATAYRGDAASLQLASRLLAQLDGLTLWTPGHFDAMVGPGGFEAFMEGFTPLLTAGSLADRAAQTRAALAHDVRAPFPDFEASARERVKARLQVVVFEHDHMVNPGPSLELARLLGARAEVLDTACGHMGPTTECEQAEVARRVNAFLRE